MQQIFRRRVLSRIVALIFSFFIYFYCSDHTHTHTHLNEPCAGLSKINLGNVYTKILVLFFCGGIIVTIHVWYPIYYAQLKVIYLLRGTQRPPCHTHKSINTPAIHNVALERDVYIGTYCINININAVLQWAIDTNLKNEQLYRVQTRTSVQIFEKLISIPISVGFLEASSICKFFKVKNYCFGFYIDFNQC